jgi:uroporphyrinogen-III decarboxylase
VCIDSTWGPFSLAHLIRGDDIFTDLYDDSKFVHHLMEVSTQLYIKALSLLKEAVGELKESGYSGNFYMSNSGVWSNEDTAVLLSLSQLEKFVFPYLRKAYKPFGGAIIHFCGRADYLLDSLLELPEVKGINLGEPNLQKLSYEEIMKKLLSKGKTYYGSWPKKEEEDTKSYFKRILAPLKGKKKNLVLAYSLTKEEQRNPQAVMELWHLLQE